MRLTPGVVVQVSELTLSSNDSYLLYITAVQRCTLIDSWVEAETFGLVNAKLSIIEDENVSNDAATQASIASIVSLIQQSIVSRGNVPFKHIDS